MKLQIIDPKYIIPVTTFCLYIYGHKYVILILYLLYSEYFSEGLSEDWGNGWFAITGIKDILKYNKTANFEL